MMPNDILTIEVLRIREAGVAKATRSQYGKGSITGKMTETMGREPGRGAKVRFEYALV